MKNNIKGKKGGYKNHGSMGSNQTHVQKIQKTLPRKN